MTDTLQNALAQLQNAPKPTDAPPPLFAGGMLQGTPIPEGAVISQRVGRAQEMPSQISVVPPKVEVPGGPQMGVIPPTGASRTTIGTFVEPSVVKPIEQQAWQTTNPLKTIGDVTTSVLEPDLEPKKKKFDFAQAILDHIFELGGIKSPE